MGAFTHDNDADAKALGVFDDWREITIVGDKDQGGRRLGSSHELHGVDGEAHVGRIFPRRITALVDEFEGGPIEGGRAPAAEPAIEIAISPGASEGSGADET